MWTVFLIISAVILIAATVAAVVIKSQNQNGGVFTPSKILLAGVVLSSVALFIPLCYDNCRASGCGLLETVLISIYNAITLFVLSGSFEFITSGLEGVPAPLFESYTVLFSVLLILATLLTLSIILSFFKNVSAYRRYLTHYNCDVYVFSRLNPKALTLAESLRNNNPKKRLLVFANAFEKETADSELVEQARKLGAVCFKRDISEINFEFHSQKHALVFFAIGEDRSENISVALRIIERFKYRANAELYVFSDLPEAELLLANAYESRAGEKPIAIKVRRVNEYRALVYRNLYENGFDRIFSSARRDASEVKRIGAAVIGMGRYGTEMTKALTWFCQMDGYEVEINSFDKAEDAEARFSSLCPELTAQSGKCEDSGESRYIINVHSGVDVDTSAFDKLIEELDKISYVFVALGDDEKNISTAIKLRMLFERMKRSPKIQALVTDSEKKAALEKAKNFRGASYDIDFIGELKTSFSEEVILASDLEAEALKRHMKWGEAKEFWRYDYNYKSSVASVIHRKMKILCKIPGAEKAAAERTEQERSELRRLEHRRWNAYMRSEGYVYGGTVEKSGRNDLAKTHNCLLPFDALPIAEQKKDDD